MQAPGVGGKVGGNCVMLASQLDLRMVLALLVRRILLRGPGGQRRGIRDGSG